MVGNANSGGTLFAHAGKLRLAGTERLPGGIAVRKKILPDKHGLTYQTALNCDLEAQTKPLLHGSNPLPPVAS